MCKEVTREGIHKVIFNLKDNMAPVLMAGNLSLSSSLKYYDILFTLHFQHIVNDRNILLIEAGSSNFRFNSKANLGCNSIT